MFRIPRVALVALALGACGPAKAADPWTFDEAVARLSLSPRDPYLQYVVLQLGRREGREKDAVEAVERPRRGWDIFGGDRGRRSRADLFATFTGALAPASRRRPASRPRRPSRTCRRRSR